MAGLPFATPWPEKVWKRFRLFSVEVSDESFEKTDLEGLLRAKEYGGIYIMLGLNEAGYPLDSLKEAYAADLEKLQALQPQAKICLLKNYGVTREKAEEVSYLSPENLEKVNGAIGELCDGGMVICLDPGSVYEDEAGYLQEIYTSDGAHPYSKALPLFAQWLCRQAQ